MNDEPLSYGHGAPGATRSSSALSSSRIIGSSWIKGVEFVEDFSGGGGYGGYSEDHEFFGLPTIHLSTATNTNRPGIGHIRKRLCEHFTTLR